MNLLLLSTWDPTRPDNGSRIRAHYLTRALAANHQVTLVTFGEEAGADGSDLDVDEFVRVQADPFRYVTLPTAVKYASLTPTAFWHIPEMWRALAPMRKREWGVVVGIQPMVARYVATFKTAKVIDVDTSLSFQMRERLLDSHALLPRARAWFSYLKARAAERLWLQRMQACTVTSGAELPYLAELLGKRVPHLSVCENGVDCQLNRLGLAPKRPATMIYNGALTYEANFDAMFYFLADIFPRIQSFVPEVEMTITGSTRGVRLDFLSLQESVRLSGFVDDIRPLVAESTVCVVPLRKGAGTRLKILEAMALGTPVVSTSKGAEGLGLVDGQHLLIADDRQGFADAVVRVLKEEGLRQRLTRNARLLMEQRYDWSIIGQQFADMVESTAGQVQDGDGQAGGDDA